MDDEELMQKYCDGMCDVSYELFFRAWRFNDR